MSESFAPEHSTTGESTPNGAAAHTSGRKSVRFVQDDSINEVCEFAPPGASIGSSVSQRESEKVAGRCSSCEALRQLFGLGAPAARPVAATELEDFANQAHILSGSLWKLNSGDPPMDQIGSWRRRLFYLQRQDDTLVLCYKSEKTNGKTTLGATVHTADGRRASLRKLEVVHVAEPSPDEHSKVCMDLFAYETSLGAKKDGPQAYKGQVPTVLHPVEVVGFGKDGEEHRLVIAAEKDKTCNTWYSLSDEAAERYQKRFERTKGGKAGR